MHRNNATKYIPGYIHVCHVSSAGASRIRAMFHITLTIQRGETQSRRAWLSSRGVPMSDIDVEDVVDAVAPSEANAARTRAVAVSLAFHE
jgi:hypothetical protein